MVHGHQSLVRLECSVTDELGRLQAPSNGTRTVTSAEPSKSNGGAPLSLTERSVDDRLDALREVIRTWDWRVASAKAGPPPSDAAALKASPLTTSSSAEVRERSEPLFDNPFPVQSSPDAPTVALVLTDLPATIDPSPPQDPEDAFVGARGSSQPQPWVDHPAAHIDDTQPVVLEPMPRNAIVELSAPEDSQEPPDGASESLRPQPGPGGPVGRLWSHPWTKVAVLGLAAVVAVVLIIGGIRLANSSPGSGAPSTTTVPRHARSLNHHSGFVAPIPAAQLTRYKQFAAGIDSANAVATRAIVGAGSTPTPAQLTPVVTSYRTAVNLYDFQLRFIPWPASMQPAMTVEHAQLEALNSFLQSIAYVTPTIMSPWLSQLHNRTGTVQTADNQIRQDLGLPSTSTFP
jgi:hypothetical protein